ncbi:MAG: ornithine cyclodeaminase family protein [Actinomycetota bacterium]|nr:MAG: ornithine cyclodeaminase family protein [Actinomycetota bacterium]
MRILSNQDVEQVLTIKDCLDALEPAFQDLARGQASNRPRSHTYTPLEPNHYYLFKSMDGSLPRLGVHGLRLSSDHVVELMENGRHRRDKLPLAPGGKFLGLVLLFSIETLELLAIMQDGYLQKMRVGATSGLAAKYLARPDSRIAGLIGTGWQADAQIMALDAVHTLQEIRVYSPTKGHSEELCRRVQPLVNTTLRPVESPKDAVLGCDIVACATNSLDPVFDGAWLAPGQHVNSLQRGELDNVTHERANVIVTRAREQSLHFSGTPMTSEVTQKGEWKPEWDEKIEELGKVMTGLEPGRTDANQITLFGGSGTGPSSGLGIQFAAVGHVIYQKACQKGLGHDIPSDWFLEDVHP